MASKTGKTAFVFAGGGSLGAIQVGALREIVLAGERADFLVGASVGALNASFFASRPDIDGVTALEAVWRGLTRQEIFPMTLRGAASWLRGGGSLLETHGLRRLIERNVNLRNLEDAALPVHIVATSLSGASVCLSHGAMVEAVMASAAIPIAFPPVRIGDEHLMDGAIAGNTPILTAAELGATRIIVLQTGYACSIDGPPKGAIARGLHALTLLIANQMERDLKLLHSSVEVHVAPHLCPLDVSPFNFAHSGELIERAAQATRFWLETGGLSRAASSEELEHDHTGMTNAVKVAAAGFDVVSYFTRPEGPLFGDAAFSAEHDGEIFHFANAYNCARFLSEPERYAPQYGGYCAFAAARNASVPGNPLAYQIVDDRLYFNLDAATHRKWARNITEHVTRANAHWRRRASLPSGYAARSTALMRQAQEILMSKQTDNSTVLNEIVVANDAYKASFGDKGQLALAPARRFAILTCMDARLDPAKYAGLAEGDAHVIRNAGGRATDDAIRSLIISHKLLGTMEWFVIHHTNCGMELFTDEVMATLLEDDLAPANFDGAAWSNPHHHGGSPAGHFIKWHTINNQQASVEQDVKRITEHPLTPQYIPIYGFIYDVATGALTPVDSATRAGRPGAGA